jgi:ribonuclease Z
MFLNLSKTLIAISLFVLAFATSSAHSQQIKVTLLGTGSPAPAMNRFGPSTLVEAGDQKLLFDAGRGVLQRLTQAKVRWQAIDGVFLTHLHSDHIVGFPDLWLTGWLVGPGRDRALEVWGPAGTTLMISDLKRAFDFDIKIRESDDKASVAGISVHAHDIKEGVVFEKDGLRVTAFNVDHGPVKPSFGYRVDYKGRSVVISGDTRASSNLIQHAQGVDLLIHEVAVPESFQRAAINAERVKSVLSHHTTPEQAGEVFLATKPHLAVLSHIVQPDATDNEILSGVRRTYAGPVEVGEDLMVIEVDNDIRIRRPSDSRN